MFSVLHAFGSFSVPDIAAAKHFYADLLGLEVHERPEGLELVLPDAASVFIYPSTTNQPAMYTVLNFVVADIDASIDALSAQGITMTHYDLPKMQTDARGVIRNDGNHPGPRAIAWFKDPAGNILSLIQEK